MGSYHLTVKVGRKGQAASHAQYITRSGPYRGRDRYEDIEFECSGNMPTWATDSVQFWEASDENERANGTTYREFEVALPRELTHLQQRELVEEFVGREIGYSHAYTLAIHNPRSTSHGDFQPHAHIMYSERQRDGYERGPELYFRRFNKKNPAVGGCKKASGGKTRAQRNTEILERRARWANVQNEYLARYGHDTSVDHRSLRDQGITNRAPGRHFGPAVIALIRRGAPTRVGSRIRIEKLEYLARLNVLEELERKTTNAKTALVALEAQIGEALNELNRVSAHSAAKLKEAKADLVREVEYDRKMAAKMAAIRARNNDTGMSERPLSTTNTTIKNVSSTEPIASPNTSFHLDDDRPPPRPR